MSRHHALLDDPAVARAAKTLWAYHRLDDAWGVTTDVGIGLGGHDLSVVDTAVQFYRCGRIPLIVFTGANAPTTIDRFPRGGGGPFPRTCPGARRPRRVGPE
ncbi:MULTISPECIES: hypothetical protein [unclassified Pseudonocardia]|uniref:hypothetical protein n=1 Tax=unclassified Pseudonocardia TaxID=2619320 RepID=UPI000B2449D5